MKPIFPEPNESEKALIAAWARGAPCEMKCDGERPIIRAAVLRALIVGENPMWPVRTGQLILNNARITNWLELAFITSRAGGGGPLPAIAFNDCEFETRINLTGAHLLDLALRCCVLPGLDCARIRLAGDLDLNGSALTATAGQLALFADRAEIEGGVFLRPREGRRFESKGTLSLASARIGTLDACGAKLDGAGSHALMVDQTEIKGGVFLRARDGHRFEAAGGIRLAGVRIGGNLDACGASIIGADSALTADKAEIAGSVFLRPDVHRFEAIGTVRLLGSQIGGDCDASGAKLDGAGGCSIAADRVNIKGSVILLPADGWSFEVVAGALRFTAARVEGVWLARDARISGLVDLSGAHVHALRDDPCTGWPAMRGMLDIDGFTYDLVQNGAATSEDPGSGLFWRMLHRTFGLGKPDAPELLRLRWLNLQYASLPAPNAFKPQPYEQLAKVLREHGHDQAADEVAIAKRDIAVRYKADRGLTRALARLMGAVSGYGYKPTYALGWITAWWLIGLAWITGALASGGIQFKPASPLRAPFHVAYVMPWIENGRFNPETIIARDEDGCPGVVTPVYALELLVPVIELGQDSACHMEGRGTVGGFIQAFRAIYEIVGTILVGILGVTLTGLLKRD